MNRVQAAPRPATPHCVGCGRPLREVRRRWLPFALWLPMAGPPVCWSRGCSPHWPGNVGQHRAGG